MTTPRGRRRNSATPTDSSRTLTSRPTALADTFSSAPAALKPPSRAAASNARTALSGGKRRCTPASFSRDVFGISGTQPCEATGSSGDLARAGARAHGRSSPFFRGRPPHIGSRLGVAIRPAAKTRRAASRPAARFTQRVPSKSVHSVGDVAQHDRHFVADRLHRNDGGNRDQRGDQHVLDGGGAIFVLHQLAENGQHRNL